MLTIDLGRLEREGTLQVAVAIPTDSPLWEGTGFTFEEPVSVDATATLAGSGEVVVRGRVGGTLAQECRRCLEPVRTEIDRELTLVFSPEDELGTSESDPEIRLFGLDADALDIGEAIREELVLDVDRYVVCRDECKGLCPLCGAELNERECDCTLVEPDPRWDALRELQAETKDA